jgi:hypothetical protein
MSDDDYDPTDEELLALEAELDALEAFDPDVARAAENYRLAVERILRGGRDAP